MLDERPLEEQLAEHDTIFTGTVTATTHDGRVATVAVDAVWRGPDLPSQVRVAGSENLGPSAFTSVDRTFEAGQPYLFVPSGPPDNFVDNACSPTQPLTAQITALAPADARNASAPGWFDRLGDWWLPGAVLLLGVAAAGFAAWRSRMG